MATGPEIRKTELCMLFFTMSKCGGSTKSGANSGKSTQKFAGCPDGFSTARDRKYCLEPSAISSAKTLKGFLAYLKFF
jgi:hypothetical protein